MCSLHPHPDDEFGSQLSLWSEGGGSFQQQFDQMEFEREEMKAKYEEIKVGGWELGTKYDCMWYHIVHGNGWLYVTYSYHVEGPLVIIPCVHVCMLYMCAYMYYMLKEKHFC